MTQSSPKIAGTRALWAPFVLVAGFALGCPPRPASPDSSTPEDTGPQVEDADHDGYEAGVDCDDLDASVHPDAQERCNGLDDDCDGAIDEELLAAFYPDQDTDGYGDGTAGLEACEAPSGYVTDGTDCDDTDATVFPGADEPCNGVDDDCDGEIDEEGETIWYRDADSDGHGDSADSQEACSPGAGWVMAGDDCDDTRADVHPGAEEVCDGADQDCDGEVDEGVLSTWYADTDADGFGALTVATEACEAPSGYVADGGDCDDIRADVFPGAEEVCDGADQDCDGDVDEGVLSSWYADADTDGFGDPVVFTGACTAPSGYVADSTDCDDGDAAIYPGAEEVCDGLDDDCDGLVDEADPDLLDAFEFFADADSDGFGDASFSTWACTQPTGFVPDATDCDDRDTFVNPDAVETCDGVDDDCDGLVDEADPDLTGALTWYADADGDGYGDAAVSTAACSAPSDFVADNTDCDDIDDSVYPGAIEPCSSADMNCDSVEPDPCGSCAEALADGYTADGLYEVDIGALGASEEVWCDMTTDGGGWTLVQRTVWDWAESGALWTSYREWADDTQGDPDEGYAYRLAGVLWPELNVDGDVLAVLVARDGTSSSDCDPLRYMGSGAVLTVGTSSATLTGLTAPVALTNHTSLSTTDTGPFTSCVAASNYGVPWFYGGCCSTCPTFKSSAWADEPHPMASYLDLTADLDGHTVADTCPSGDALHSYYGTGAYEGVNSMAYYLR